MKILHIVDSLERGGQESFLIDLAVAQKRMGHEISILCLKCKGVLEEKATAHNIPVSSLECNQISKFRALSRVRSEIERIAPDVLHAHNRLPLIMSICAMPRHSSRIINTRHGNGVRGLYWSMAATFAHKIINVSQKIYDQSNIYNKSILNRKNIVIRNGVNVNSIHSRGNRIGSLIMVSRLHKVKNHAFALQIVKECINQDLPVKLQIVGDGPEADELKKSVSLMNLDSIVSFLGDRGDVSELLSESDIFLLTSWSEGHSIALLEATATGLPSVVTDVGGNSEIVQDGVTGFVVPFGDVSAFVDSIRILIEDRSLWRKFSENAVDWALNNASMDACAILHQKVYRPEGDAISVS